MSKDSNSVDFYTNFNVNFNIIVNRTDRTRNFINKIYCPILTSLLSGSPVIQNGKLVGAVTHVFVNDPTRGYGIFIENMLAEAEKIK